MASKLAGRNIAQQGGRRSYRGGPPHQHPNGGVSSSQIPDTNSVLAAAMKESELAASLRDQIAKYRDEKAEKQMEVEEDATREVRNRVEELSGDIEELSARLSGNLSKLAELEKAQMELELGNRRKAQFLKERAEPVRIFKEGSEGNKNAEVHEMLETEEAALRNNRQAITQCIRELSLEIEERYQLNRELENEIEQRRHELVIDKELLRTRQAIDQQANAGKKMSGW